MAASADVAAYRASGHSVAETMALFGISESAVYKACRVVKARRIAARPARASIARSSDAAAPVFVDRPDDVAGVSTHWRHPVTGELVRVPTGAHRQSWELEQKVLHAQLQACDVGPAAIAGELESPAGVDLDPSPSPVPPAFEASQSYKPEASPPPPIPAPPVGDLHKRISPPAPRYRAPVNRSAPSWQEVAIAWAPPWARDYWRLEVGLLVLLVLIRLAFGGV